MDHELINKRLYIIPAIILLMVATFSQCMEKRETGKDPRGDGYTGSTECMSCHSAISQSYFHTAHQMSTQPASRQNIAGSFSKDSNEYFYKPNVKVAMEQRDSGFFQVAYKNDTAVQAQRFDIVVGSGRKAQTYLYWYEDKVYQLPVSYYIPLKSWANSPNYPTNQVRFDRSIPIGCFECHGSFIERTSIEPAGQFYIDHFDKNKIVYGIDCERCHGPAAKHVAFHKNHPNDSVSKYLMSFKDLTRQQKLDQCAACHSGIKDTRRSLFYFRPGSSLNDYVHADTSTADINDIDVHGNQYQLLAASACFIKSKTLDCSSCHNPHLTERNNLGGFSQRCMSCHNTENQNFCKMAPKLGAGIVNNCIDCHMPAKPSKLITLLSQGQTSLTANLVRTHFISVYKEESEKVMSSGKLNK
jgi:hypothetical protein